MLTTFKTLLIKNIEWKLISLAVASVLWFTVISSLNPVSTEFFQVQLSVRNAQALTANNLVLMNMDELVGRNMGITVRAARSDIEALRQSMALFTAYVDLAPIDISHTMDIDEPMNITVRYQFPPFIQDARYTVMSPPETVAIVLDRYATRPFGVQVLRDGDVTPGIIHHQPIVNPASLQVSGPETVIDTIDHLYTIIDLTDIYTGTARFSEVSVVDVLGEDITDRVQLSIPSVLVQVAVSSYGAVTVRPPAILGSPAEGYVFSGVQVSPLSVEVVGDETTLRAMQQLGIALHAADISGRNESFYIVNDMREHLMDTALHIRNLTPHETVTHITIEPIVTREFTFGANEIALTADTGHDGEEDDAPEADSAGLRFEDEEVTVRLLAARPVAEALTASDITLRAVVTNADIAAGSVAVTVDVPEGVILAGEIRIGITADAPPAEEDTESPDE
ncbi:MAG: CdaR family protein [Defluviitaleaceae bacterium]|nr:CdaR family protein [Defluviitaleaceae bacterium]